MPRVKLPNGKYGKFPDDMPYDQIETVLKKQFPPNEAQNESEIAPTPFNQQQEEITADPNNNDAEAPFSQQNEQAPQENKGWKALGEDVITSLSNALKGGSSFSWDIPNKLNKAGEYIEKNPGSSILHYAGQLAAGAASFGKAAVNMPHDIIAKMGEKDVIPEWLKKYNELPFTHIPEDTGVEKFLGLEADPEKGDDLFRALPDMAALGYGALTIGKSAYKKATAPSKERVFKRALENKINVISKQKDIKVADLEKLKNALTDEYTKLHGEKPGALTPQGQSDEINIKSYQLEKNPKKNEIPEGELPDIPEAPDTKKMLDDLKKSTDEAKDAAEKGLDILDNPSIKAGGKIKKAIEDVKGKASELYKAARNHYVDKEILADNSKEIKSVTKDLQQLKDADELAPGYGSGTAEQEALNAHLEALKTEKVKASDVFDLQKTLETMANNARDKQFASGKGATQLDRKKYGEMAERFDNHANKLAKRLEDVGGKEVQQMMVEANKGWRTYKQLTLDNPVGKAAMKGNIPNKALIRLAEDHNGNDFLKGLVQSDPELRKNFLAAYAGEKNINNLLKPSSAVKRYIESLPEVEDKLNAFKNAVSEYKVGEQSAVKVNKAHDDLVKSMKQVAEAKKLQQQIEFHKNAIPKIKEKMKKIDAKSEEHAKLSKELKEHENHLSDKNYLLKKYGKGVIGFLGLNEIRKKLGL